MPRNIADNIKQYGQQNIFQFCFQKRLLLLGYVYAIYGKSSSREDILRDHFSTGTDEKCTLSGASAIRHLGLEL